MIKQKIPSKYRDIFYLKYVLIIYMGLLKYFYFHFKKLFFDLYVNSKCSRTGIHAYVIK